jgi:four helix bundle protein
LQLSCISFKLSDCTTAKLHNCTTAQLNNCITYLSFSLTVILKRMATIKDFEGLEIWKNARMLTRQVYQDFQIIKDFGFRDQIQRSAVSVMNNIAEGFCRSTEREKVNFLNFARGSVGEVKNMYYVAEDLKYLSPETSMNRRNSAQGLMNGISSFMKYLKNYNQK